MFISERKTLISSVDNKCGGHYIRVIDMFYHYSLSCNSIFFLYGGEREI